MRKTRVSVSVVIALLLASPLRAKKFEEGESPAATSWLVIKPVQCLDNAWEKDWLEQNHAEASTYPVADEKKTVLAYFARNGVRISEIRTKPYDGGPRCDACNCPRGDTLYLLMDSADTAAVKALGFDRVLPNLKPARKK